MNLLVSSPVVIFFPQQVQLIVSLFVNVYGQLNSSQGIMAYRGPLIASWWNSCRSALWTVHRCWCRWFPCPAVWKRTRGSIAHFRRDRYRRLCAGRFNQREAFAFDYTAPHAEVHITACMLEYLVDSKGFRQPVYYFTLSDEQDMALRGGNGWRVFVPALT